MAGFRLPGPYCSYTKPLFLDDGTSCRMPSAPPDPVNSTQWGATTDPIVQIVSPVAGTKFSITNQPKMPRIDVIARVTGVLPDPSAKITFSWRAEVKFNSSGCKHGVHSVRDSSGIAHSSVCTTSSEVLTGSCIGGKFSLQFTEIRGGNLELTVTANIGARSLVGKGTNVRIQGTNPAAVDIVAALPDDAIRRIICRESSFRQFIPAPNEENALYPQFSRDDLLGVGLGQITNPPPSPDEVWNWRANLAAAVSLYNEKKSIAQNYPKQVANSAGFKSLVNQLNQALAADPTKKAKIPVAVEVKYNDEQVLDDAIRAYNGFGAYKDDFGFPQHEFQIETDDSGNLVYTGDPSTGKVQAVWEKVPEDERSQNGDYVRIVKRCSPSCGS